MKKWSIDPSLFAKNRKNLSDKLMPDSIAIINSNDLLPTNADGTFPFVQNTDLFYLTGINQEETILLLYPDSPDEKMKTILFVTETNPQIEVWHGKKYSKEEASKISGIDTVYWVDDFDTILDKIALQVDNIYINLHEHSRAAIEIQSRDYRMLKNLKNRFPIHKYHRLAPLIHSLRMIKDPIEVELIKKACDITESAFRRILKFLKPGITEYEVEAEFAHEFIRNKAKFAYNPIIASGEGACVLHYEKNDEVCQDGHLLLLDVGASFAYYNADMSRTIPVNGHFTDRQKKVYQSVLNVLKLTRKELVPGKKIKDIQSFAEDTIKEELIKLGLISSEQLKNKDETRQVVKKYFPHGVSHLLGLDVHDVGDSSEILKPGMLFTCEPGIYIKEESLGVRLENNILLTESGNIDLMSSIPIEIDEIEQIMNR